jgi:hypothetical protein
VWCFRKLGLPYVQGFGANTPSAPLLRRALGEADHSGFPDVKDAKVWIDPDFLKLQKI